jgi:diaminopimelate decarboxylase
MDYFGYKQGKLYAENVAVAKIAEAVGTPVYIYSKATYSGPFLIASKEAVFPAGYADLLFHQSLFQH